MANPHGTPIWHELMTSDPAAAGAFYTHAAGWTLGAFAGNTTLTGSEYQIFSAPDGEGVGGMMALPEPMAAMGPSWFVYFGVDDVDAAAAKITAEGGTVHMPPMDLPGVGRMAMCADPGGAAFYVMRGSSPEDSKAFGRNKQGHGEWLELRAADDAVALAFYEAVFGFRKDGAMPMGEMGEYSFIAGADGVIGAIMRAPPGQRPCWNLYFRTGDIDAAKARIEEAGGAVTNGPHEVPGGDWVVQAKDPQGASFGLVGSR